MYDRTIDSQHPTALGKMLLELEETSVAAASLSQSSSPHFCRNMRAEFRDTITPLGSSIKRTGALECRRLLRVARKRVDGEQSMISTRQYARSAETCPAVLVVANHSVRIVLPLKRRD